jgi:hypothetical protein
MSESAVDRAELLLEAGRQEDAERESAGEPPRRAG